MGFAPELLDCLLRYESVTTQLARNTPTAVKKAVFWDKAKKNSIVLQTYVVAILHVARALSVHTLRLASIV